MLLADQTNTAVSCCLKALGFPSVCVHPSPATWDACVLRAAGELRAWGAPEPKESLTVTLILPPHAPRTGDSG